MRRGRRAPPEAYTVLPSGRAAEPDERPPGAGDALRRRRRARPEAYALPAVPPSLLLGDAPPPMPARLEGRPFVIPRAAPDAYTILPPRRIADAPDEVPPGAILLARPQKRRRAWPTSPAPVPEAMPAGRGWTEPPGPRPRLPADLYRLTITARLGEPVEGLPPGQAALAEPLRLALWPPGDYQGGVALPEVPPEAARAVSEPRQAPARAAPDAYAVLPTLAVRVEPALEIELQRRVEPRALARRRAAPEAYTITVGVPTPGALTDVPPGQQFHAALVRLRRAPVAAYEVTGARPDEPRPLPEEMPRASLPGALRLPRRAAPAAYAVLVGGPEAAGSVAPRAPGARATLRLLDDVLATLRVRGPSATVRIP